MKTKPVVTLTEEGLETAAQQLAAIMADAGFQPDGIVGIATGGELVAAAMPNQECFELMTCALRRPGTARKKNLRIGFVLRHFPYALTNILRQIEDYFGERNQQLVSLPPEPSSKLNEDLDRLSAIIAKQGLTRIVVIDDAVDSGATLSCVLTALRGRLPKYIDLRTAVITKTRTRTAIEPNFKLYDDTLCRFPWSFDYRMTK
ncbi:MAG: phosphoribosyltransferase [Marinosulfonomonas sp.]